MITKCIFYFILHKNACWHSSTSCFVTLPPLRPTLAEVWYAGKPEQVNWLIKINKMEMIYLSRWNLMDLDTLGEQSGGILLLDPGHDHAAATLLPVHWGGHLPGGGKLQAVHNP